MLYALKKKQTLKCFHCVHITADSGRHSERAQEPALTLPASIEKNKDTSHEKKKK